MPPSAEKHLPRTSAVLEQNVSTAVNFGAAPILWDANIWVVVPLQRFSTQLFTNPSIAGRGVRVQDFHLDVIFITGHDNTEG